MTSVIDASRFMASQPFISTTPLILYCIMCASVYYFFVLHSCKISLFRQKNAAAFFFGRNRLRANGCFQPWILLPTIATQPLKCETFQQVASLMWIKTPSLHKEGCAEERGALPLRHYFFALLRRLQKNSDAGVRHPLVPMSLSRKMLSDSCSWTTSPTIAWPFYGPAHVDELTHQQKQGCQH